MMKKIEILNKYIGEIYVKECLGGKPLKYSCICPCGCTFESNSQKIRTKNIDCGCGAVTGIRQRILKAGDVYEGSEIISVSKKYSQNSYVFRCSGCGNEFEKTHTDFYKHPICPACLKAKNKADKVKKLNDDFAGKEINGIKILKMDIEDGRASAVALCPVCGNEFNTKLSRIKIGISSCGECIKSNLDRGHEIIKEVSVDGTNTLSLMRKNKNKNNSSGYNGVNRMRNGRYRAYIVFKRKQYHLGVYDTAEDAARVRKIAEDKIFGGFLEWFAEEFPEQWEKINKNNKSI